MPDKVDDDDAVVAVDAAAADDGDDAVVNRRSVGRIIAAASSSLLKKLVEDMDMLSVSSVSMDTSLAGGWNTFTEYLQQNVHM